MFKKNILALSLSIAMASTYAVNAAEITTSPLSPEVQQEITKYSVIIGQLKSQLKQKEDYNAQLQEKLNTAVNLVKTIEPDKITTEQMTSLNKLILTLTQTTQENSINNKELSKKIGILETFLITYKDNQLKGIKSDVASKKEAVISTPNPVVEDSKKVVIPTTDGISNSVLEANKALEKQNIELRKEQDKKNSVVTPEKITFDDTVKTDTSKTVENINVENKDNVLKDGKNEEKSDIKKIDSVKTLKQTHTTKPIVQPVFEEKTFMETFEEKIESAATWFKELFGMQDTIGKEPAPDIVPSKIEMQMKKDKLAQIVKEQQESKEKSDKEKQNVENKDNVQIDETPVQLKDKDFNKKEAITPVNLTPEIKIENKAPTLPEENIIKTNIEVQSDLPVKSQQDVKSIVDETPKPTLEPLKLADVKTTDPVLVNENTETNKAQKDEIDNFIKSNENNTLPVEAPVIKSSEKAEMPNVTNDIKDTEKEISNPAVKDTTNGDMIILKAKKPVSQIDANFKDQSYDMSAPLNQPRLYSVKKGDNLTKIVKIHYDTKSTQDTVDKVQELASLNSIEAKDLIHIGDVIRIS